MCPSHLPLRYHSSSEIDRLNNFSLLPIIITSSPPTRRMALLTRWTVHSQTQNHANERDRTTNNAGRPTPSADSFGSIIVDDNDLVFNQEVETETVSHKIPHRVCQVPCPSG